MSNGGGGLNALENFTKKKGECLTRFSRRPLTLSFCLLFLTLYSISIVQLILDVDHYGWRKAHMAPPNA